MNMKKPQKVRAAQATPMALETQYARFFVPPPQNAPDSHSLEQPWFQQIVPSITTYSTPQEIPLKWEHA